MNQKLIDMLINLGYKISFAESCTGGLLADSVVSVSDASKVFDEGFVTYSNEAKIKYLNVSKETILKYGVVSEEVAKEMVIGACKASNANVGVSTTGIAGPTGETKNKPIGMVCFGFKVNDLVVTKTKYFGSIGRNEVRKASVSYAIEEIYQLLNYFK